MIVGDTLKLIQRYQPRFTEKRITTSDWLTFPRRVPSKRKGLKMTDFLHTHAAICFLDSNCPKDVVQAFEDILRFTEKAPTAIPYECAACVEASAPTILNLNDHRIRARAVQRYSLQHRHRCRMLFCTQPTLSRRARRY